MTTARYRVSNLDFPSDMTLGDFSDHLVEFNATVARYVPRGPGGGNPCVTLEFSSRESATALLEKYDPTDGVELYPITCVAGTLDQIDDAAGK